MASWRAAEGGHLKEQDLGCVVGEEGHSEFCDCLPCFQTCVWSRPLQLKEHNSNISVRSNHPETLLQDFKSWNVQV